MPYTYPYFERTILKGWFGYYYTVSEAYGDHLDKIKGYCNWAHLDISAWDLDRTVELAERCRRARVAVAYSAIPFIWVPGTPYTLDPAWQANLAAALPKFEAFRTRDVLHSLYIGDEPTANGITQADLTTVCIYIREILGYDIMVVEEYGNEAASIPDINYYGLTVYTPNDVSLAEAEIVSRVDINFVLAQGFNELPLAIPDQNPWMEIFRKVAHRDGIGMPVFLAPSFSNGATDYIGSLDDETTVLQHKVMAWEVRRGSEIPDPYIMAPHPGMDPQPFELAPTPARFGAARFGAARFGFNPSHTMNPAGTADGLLTGHKRVYSSDNTFTREEE
jgi:hypothetical protein